MAPERRLEAQNRIKDSAHYLARRFPSLVGEGFRFSYIFGDEWQLVTRNADKAYTVYTQLYYLMKGFPFYCGIGVGEILTPQASNTHEMDGPAFHLARQALNEAKQSSRKAVIRLAPSESDVKYEQVLQPFVQLLEMIRDQHRGSQVEAIQYAMLNQPDLKSLAERLGVHRTAALRRLQTSGYKAEVEALQSIEALLLAYVRERNSRPFTVDPDHLA